MGRVGRDCRGVILISERPEFWESNLKLRYIQ